MCVGKRLETDMVERWRPHYLQYKLLKKHIKDLEDSKEGPVNGNDAASTVTGATADEANGLLVNQQISYHEFSFPGPKAHRYSVLSAFKSVLDKEVEKINGFVTSKVSELQNRLLQLLRTQPWKSGTTATKLSQAEMQAGSLLLDQQSQEVNTIAEELVDLDKFIRQNCIAIQKIIKKFDKRLQFDVAPWLNAQLMENEPFLKVNLDALLIALSDVFVKLNGFQKDFLVMTGKSAGGDDHKKGISAQTFERKTTKYWVRSENLMAIKVAILKNLPVYLFDRKNADGETARPRNFLRDFGDVYGSMSDSAPITSIYLDNDSMDSYRTRLTREEGAQLFRFRWYGDAKSLPEKDYVFLERKTHHESWVTAKSVKERFPIKSKHVQPFLEGKFSPAESMKKWMKPDAKGLKLIKNDSELEKAVTLANESFNTVQKTHLKSMVRTLYRRTAFQASDHNEVRISIDTNLMMVNEDVVPASNNEFPWCRDMVHSSIPPSDILQFPYCILEVKLNCDNPPKWIADLLSDTNTIVECHKFSKFLTGIAYHQYAKIQELPHWMKDQFAIDPRNRFMSPEEKEKLMYQDNIIRFTETQGEIAVKKPLSSEDTIMPDHRTIDIPDVKVESTLVHQDEDEDENTPLVSNNSGQQSTLVVSPMRSNSNVGFLGSLRRRLLGNQTQGSLGGSQEKHEPLKPVRATGRVKVEPKTSFANERTLIQWVSAASLMITLATLIMTSGSDLGFQAGFVFFPLAFVIMIYAIIRYQYRAWSFRNRRNEYHDDLYGPVFLVIAIASAMGVIMYLMFHFNAPLPSFVPTNDVKSGCQQLSTYPIEEFFPFSDLALIGQSLVAVGPFAYATLSSPSNEWTVTSVPSKQIVSISSPLEVNNGFLVGIERPSLQIVQVAGNQMKTIFDLTEFKQSFNLSVKAMADLGQNIILLPDEDGSLYKLQLKYPSNSTGKPSASIISMIPSTRIAEGLVDEPFYTNIAGMFYEPAKSKLYVLFDKARRIRVFDGKTFQMLNEWYLPGTSLQWSGLVVTHDIINHESFLYMSQSIPSQLWKFKLTQDAIDGKATVSGAFSACANVYERDLSELMISNMNDKFRRSRPRYVSNF